MEQGEGRMEKGEGRKAKGHERARAQAFDALTRAARRA